MKKLLLSAAFAAALATPAFAQSYSSDYGTGNINPPVASLRSNDPNAAYAYEPREVYGHSMRRPHAVYSNGEYRGRRELRNEYPQD